MLSHWLCRKNANPLWAAEDFNSVQLDQCTIPKLSFFFTSCFSISARIERAHSSPTSLAGASWSEDWILKLLQLSLIISLQTSARAMHSFPHSHKNPTLGSKREPVTHVKLWRCRKHWMPTRRFWKDRCVCDLTRPRWGDRSWDIEMWMLSTSTCIHLQFHNALREYMFTSYISQFNMSKCVRVKCHSQHWHRPHWNTTGPWPRTRRFLVPRTRNLKSCGWNGRSLLGYKLCSLRPWSKTLLVDFAIYKYHKTFWNSWCVPLLLTTLPWDSWLRVHHSRLAWSFNTSRPARCALVARAPLQWFDSVGPNKCSRKMQESD